ncbi:nucleoside triphosphate hydrolase domain-containing protein [Gammaproteobacteria bacterium MOLA455]|nr:nucleoside triphosphate hydrolase domain-containing protein [Gammaproteobacteria bacterium MOLA455]
MSPAEQQFLSRNKLPESYLLSAARWFSPLLEKYQSAADKPLIIGINGSQGSGKSTLADYLCSMLSERYQLRCVSLSLDDFYLTKRQRQQLAKQVHPLLATRGVPGTHDIPLALETIAKLVDGSAETLIPRFDKSRDDRMPEAQCDRISGAVDIIVFEGWCVGAQAQSDEQLNEPVNSLESEQDADLVWRTSVNQALAGEYQVLFGLLDELIMLQAPSFESVFNWRLEQEEKLAASLGNSASDKHQGIMSATQIGEFIAHYQRITEHSLGEMPQRADHLFRLDSQRQIVDYLHH